MAQTALEGKNAVLEAYRDNSGSGGVSLYVPFACLTNFEFYYDTEMVQRATKGTGGHWGYRPGMGDWGLRASGVSHIVAPDGSEMYTVFDTLKEQLRKNGLDIRLIFEDSLGNLQVITGHVLIPHTGITSPAEGFVEDEVEYKGDGAFALSTTLADPVISEGVKEYNYTAIGGETELTVPDTISRNVLYVGRSGIGSEVVESGTPTSAQVKYTTSAGTFLFGSELSPDEWVLILYQ